MSNKENKQKDEIKDECQNKKENNCNCQEEQKENKDENCNCNQEENKKCTCQNKDKEKECEEKEEKKEDNQKKSKNPFKKNNKEVEELTNQVASLKESLLRNQAELQNYKRRKDEETERILKYKDEDLIKELLPIVDNLERAIKMDDNDLTDEVSRFLEGFKIIYTNTLNMLEKFQVKEITAEGAEFDPNYHHAVLTDHDENKPEGVILEVLQKGYTYKDRVIRPAMVKVNE